MLSGFTIHSIHQFIDAMKTVKPSCILLTILLFSIGVVSAITSDELAAFLGISSWHTEVDLPSDSYIVQIFGFADGKIAETDLGEMTKTVKSSNDLAIIAGKQDGTYKFTIINAEGSYGIPTSEPALDRTLSPHLPEKVKEGDFILFGKPLLGSEFHRDNDIHSYVKDYLLRIKKTP